MPAISLTAPIKSDHYIHQWLSARQQWMVLFNQLCHLRPFADTCEVDMKEQLTELCIVLMDYISLGHFKVFEKVAIAPVLMESLYNTTHFALDFNDKYQFSEDLSSLESDLSQLGETLAKRFDWEDQLAF